MTHMKKNILTVDSSFLNGLVSRSSRFCTSHAKLYSICLLDPTFQVNATCIKLHTLGLHFMLKAHILVMFFE